MDTIKRQKRILILIICGCIVLLSVQEKKHQATLRQIQIYRATVSAMDSETEESLNKSVKLVGGQSSSRPLPRCTSFTGSGERTICQWVGIHPREIQISAEGYSTQSVMVASGWTNIVASLTKLTDTNEIEQEN